MKKTFLSILGILFLNIGFSQEIQTQLHKLQNGFNDTTYEGFSVVELPNADKNAIYSKVKLWISKRFVSSKYVIDLDDKSSDVYRIVIKPLMLIHVVNIKGINEYDVHVNYNMFFTIKDDKVKMELKDFYCSGMNGTYSDGPVSVVQRPKRGNYSVTEKMWPKLRQDCRANAIELLEDFEKKLPSINNSDDDF